MNKWMYALPITFTYVIWGITIGTHAAGTKYEIQKSVPSPVTSQPPSPDDQIAAKINMTGDLRFDPDRVTIHSGQTIVWKNMSNVVHTVTDDPAKVRDKDNVESPDGATPFDSGSIEPGEVYSHTFTFPGTYRYVCIPHEEMGMKGLIIVKPAGDCDVE